MGSEMCIRDSLGTVPVDATTLLEFGHRQQRRLCERRHPDAAGSGCLLYTSDAADERSRVDLGGSRIIKKKKPMQADVVLHNLKYNEKLAVR